MARLSGPEWHWKYRNGIPALLLSLTKDIASMPKGGLLCNIVKPGTVVSLWCSCRTSCRTRRPTFQNSQSPVLQISQPVRRPPAVTRLASRREKWPTIWRSLLPWRRRPQSGVQCSAAVSRVVANRWPEYAQSIMWRFVSSLCSLQMTICTTVGVVMGTYLAELSRAPAAACGINTNTMWL